MTNNQESPSIQFSTHDGWTHNITSEERLFRWTAIHKYLDKDGQEQTSQFDYGLVCGGIFNIVCRLVEGERVSK
jgi:hypothetical protein